MAATGWRTDSPLRDTLFERACEFDFFQAVRLLARIFPDRKQVGTRARPSEEIVRFGAWLSLAFPASAIDAIERTPDSDQPVRMTITFLALTGIQGVLPVYYTERMLARKAGRNDALVQFFDLFNHRLVSFFYRAWQKHRFPALYESAALESTAPDLFTRSLFDLIGMGTSGLQGRMRVADESLLRYAGLVAQTPHSASALQRILRDYFGVAVRIEQCRGSWYELAPDDRAYLAPDGERNQLGVGAFLGDKVWDQQARFRISLGPIDFTCFQDFLPDGAALPKLLDLARFLGGQALAVDVQLVLRADQVPDARLTDQGTDAPRLGWSSWLKTTAFESDAADAVFAYRN
ncbi:MAG TPA: type VI secretion system baseplate subunit TssG [Bryobacteraceae bacterium]|jgi:type VI secretion system protein ImpH